MIRKLLLKSKTAARIFGVVCLLLLPLVSGAQNNLVTVSGTVTDQSSIPMPGVSVIVEGTSSGAVTDIDGNYSFTATLQSREYKLVASYIGFQSQSATFSGSQSTVSQNFTLLEDLLSLDEVIVTGTGGNVSRRQLGNAIGTIKAESIASTGSNNPLSAISGKVLGAQVTQNSGDPAGGFSVRLRGISTISGSSEPLYIIDGVIVDNSSQNVINLNADAQGTGFQAGQNRLVDINPNDIESIEVLNGASAAAIYGSLASNGVVQIITKKGKSGEPKVSFSTGSTASWVRKRLDINDYPFRFGIPGCERLFTAGDRLTMIANLRPDRSTNPGTGPNGLGGPLDETTYAVTRYDYQDAIFRDTAFGTENNLSLTGGSEKTNYFFSANYSRNQGIIDDTFFQKYGSRLNLSHSFSDKFKIQTGLTYTNSSSEDKPNGNNFFNPISTIMITDNVWNIWERNEAGELLHVEPVRLNPLTTIENFEITQETNRVIANATAFYTPIKNLDLKYTFGIDTYTLKGNTLQERVPYTGVSTSFFPDGYVSVATSSVFNRNNDFTANYKWDISDLITSTTTLGGQYLYRKVESTSAEGRNLSVGIQTIRGAFNYFSNPTEARSEFSLWGYYLQENLSFDNKIYLTLAGRIDGASSFSKDQRNQFYPKVSSSIILSDFDFWNKESFWNTFKLRASYGEAGNLTAIGPYSRLTTASPALLVDLGSLVPNSFQADPNITPERMKEFEVGTDLSFFKNRLAIQATYYTQQVDDLILSIGTAPTTGRSSYLTNIGTMNNHGVELMISGSPVRTQNFQWDASLSFSTYNNEVSNVGGGRTGFELRGGGGTQRLIEGEALGVFLGNYFARNEDGSLLLDAAGLPQVERGNDLTGEPLRNAAGQPTGDPLRKIMGDPNPDYSASFINEIRWKKFNFRMQWDALGGFQVYNWNSITLNNVGAGPLAEKELRGEVPRGYVAAIGGFRGPRIQEYHVEDGDFIKLRELQIGYDFDNLGFTDNLNVSLIGRNLLSIDDYSGYDPETNSAGQSNAVRGDDFGNVPIPASFQLRLTASF